jgi:menaquinone-dependent protoporphyrinogen oxidase
MRRLKVIYATHDGQTAKVAAAVGEAARESGWTVDVYNCKKLPYFSFIGYDAVAIAAPIHAGNYLAPIRRFIKAHRNEIALSELDSNAATMGAAQE